MFTEPSLSLQASPPSLHTPLGQDRIPADIFRAYDIRGIVGQSLLPAGVEQIGRAIGSEVLRLGEHTVVVGRDGRLSGVDLKEALVRGILSTGCHVLDMGCIPTPLLYFAAHYCHIPSGVMITGSHNPSEYNGFKIVLGAKALYGDGIQKLRQVILQNHFLEGAGTYSEEAIIQPYVQRLRTQFLLSRPLKVVIDAGNGIAGLVAPLLYRALGCEVIPLFCEVDGSFPNHHPDPGQPANLAELRKTVVEQGADLGLAFDGDGDRLGVIDSQGHIIWPDRVLMLFAECLLKKHAPAQIIFDVKCSRALAPFIKRLGGTPCMWKTGHSLIKAKMRESGALLAGEMSGHFFFADWYGFDDALYAGARLLKCLVQQDPRISSAMLFANLPDSVSTPEIMLRISEAEKFSCVQQLSDWAAAQPDFSSATLCTIDGLRADFSDGFGLVRASNTTDNLILRFEADNQDTLERIKAIFRTLLKQFKPQWDLPF